MLIGIDSFDTHLDMVAWPEFQLWNGGTLELDLSVTGGQPSFAGRNFLAGDFIWGHAEATTAMKAAHPDDLAKLELLVTRIAPIQAAQASRQAALGERGFLYGQADAHALCTRVANSIRAGEFARPDSLCLWLAVDPDAEFSLPYWAAWADTVNGFPMPGVAAADPVTRPFCAAILCRYNRVGGRFKRDPHVGPTLLMAALASAFGALITTCHDFWADAPDADADGVRPAPVLDWSLFDAAEMPSIWRFSNSFRDAAGTPATVSYALDVVREPVLPEVFVPATSFMLHAQKWQPNVPSIQDCGFIVSLEPPGATALTNAQIVAIQGHAFPPLTDLGGHYNIPAHPVHTVGRYLRTAGHGHSMAFDEASRLSAAGFRLFTIWESFNVLAGGEPTMNDPPPAVQKAFKVGIAYFDPAVHAGTEDARAAFAHCGNVLHQPPHTPVFFCVDFDAADPGDTRPVSTADARARIENYLSLVKAERDSYAQANPGRYYLIGLYANGEVNRWAYEQGIASSFWQSVGPGSSGNGLPNRPWYHANRWQFNREAGLNPTWPHVQGADPDADWGDGGTWNLNDPLSQALTNLEAREVRKFFNDFLPVFAGLLP